MSKFQQEIKNKSSKIKKTHKWLKNSIKIQKNATQDALKNHMPYVKVFKPHFSTCKTEIHLKAW